MRKILKIDPKLFIPNWEKLNEIYHEPKVIRVKEFTESALDEFEKDMNEAHNTGQPVIPIVIDSFGGSTYGCMGMIAAVEQATLPVATVCSSKAMSAGACLFCFGTEGYRFLDPNAVLMIHDAGSFTFGKVEDIKADAKHIDEINQKMYKRIAKHLGHPENYILDIIKTHHNHVDWFLSAKEAKKHNIANHLRVPDLTISITTEVTFG